MSDWLIGARRALARGLLTLTGMGALAATAQAGILTVPLYGSNFRPITFNASYTPPRDVTVGTVLQPNQPTGINYGMSVDSVYCPIYKRTTVSGMPVPGMPDTYQTNVPGVGVRFFTTTDWNGTWERAPSSTAYYPPSSWYASTAWYTSAALVVTGPVGSGRLTSLPSMTVEFTGSCFRPVTRIQTIAPGTVITPATCMVTTPSISVTLPNVKASDFSGVGAARGDTGLRIGLNCRGGVGADVHLTLTDATDPGNTTNLLTPAPGSTARGVQLRVLYNGVPVNYGPDSAMTGNLNQWRGGPSSSVTSVPLTAQYISTGTVLPGVVKGIATFTMSYQ